MLVTSTFTADYLRAPLQHLLNLLSLDTALEISYGDLMPKLAALKTGLQAPPDIWLILVRIKDLVASLEEEATLQLNLEALTEILGEVKSKIPLPIVIALCPSYYEDPLQQSSAIQAEKRITDQLKQHCSAFITLEDIQQYYPTLTDIHDPINESPYHIPYQPQFYVGLACLLVRHCHFLKTKPHKVIAVDCDDTLWTGVAASIGVEGVRFEPHNLALQTLLIEQYKAGALICLVSQNDPEIIFQVFEQRQKEMRLNRSHIAAYQINYGLKSDNLAALAQEFENMELGRFIFIDDSAQECAQIKYALPMVCVLQMPQQLPAFQKLFQHVWALDRGKTTEADQQRTQFYQNNTVRSQLLAESQSQNQSYAQFIQTLNLISAIEPATTSKHYDRIAQLTENCTQFNLTGHVKLSASHIEAYLSKPQAQGWLMEVEDKFGKYGVVCAAIGQIAENVFICEEFFVSCRGFKKALEYQFIQHMAHKVSSQANFLQLPFQATERNIPAKKFLDILSEAAGIKTDGQNFIFDVQALTQIDPAELAEKAIAQTQLSKVNHAINSYKKADYEQLAYWTSTLEPLLDEYFIGKEALSRLSRTGIEEGIEHLCKKLLSLDQIKPEVALILQGLNSLKATQLAYFLYQQYQVKIAIPFLLSEQLTVQSLAQAIRQQATIKPLEKAVASSMNGALISATFQQRRLWLNEQNHVARSFDHHMIIPFSSAPFDITALQQACQILLERHEILRTGLSASSQHIVSQCIFPPDQVKLDFEILTLKEDADLGVLIREVASEPFLLKMPPLIRFKVFKTNSDYYFVICVHHIIFDALSLNIIISELTELLHLSICEPPAIAYPPATQYRNLVAQQQQNYGEAYQTEALDYLLKQLRDTEVAQFPPDHARNLYPASSSARHEFAIPQNLHIKLIDTARTLGVTVNSLMFSAYSLLVGAYANQNHFAVLTAASGRETDPAFQHTVGFFVNLLPLAVHLQGDMRFIDYVKTNQAALLKGLAYQHIRFERLQQQLQQNGIPSALTNPAFIYQNYPAASLKFGDQVASLIPPVSSILYDLRETTRFGDFTLFVREAPESLLGMIEYAKAHYSPAFIAQITRNFLYLLEAVCQEPLKKIRDISCVCTEEKKYLSTLTQISSPHYDNRSLVALFQQQVIQRGELPAVSQGGHTRSYDELNRQSDSVAFALLKHGVQENDFVGVYAQRSLAFVIAVLAILKVGAAYVPIPPDYPIERQRYIIEDAKLNVLLHDQCEFIAPDSFQVTWLNIQQVLHSSSPTTHHFPETTANHLAYLMYTSGSTGTPKGIAIKQEGVVRLVVQPNYIEFTPADRIAFASNPAFDAATFEIFGALLNGACLVVLDHDEIADIDRLERKLMRERITILWLTAGLFHYYATHRPALFKQLNYLLAGGDALNPRAIEKIFDCAQGRPKHILNGYGPTENTTFTATYEIPTKKALQNKSWVPIGKPINHTSCYILGKWGQQIPLGAKGELYIGGKGLGCYRHPTLQAQRFVTIASVEPGLFFKSEDIVRYDLEGNIVYLGRTDDQIKILGNLVVLSEIEHHLAAHEAVEEALVLAKPQVDNSKKLVVFYTAKPLERPLATESLRSHLSQRLPAFMVPIFYILLETFPLTHNGKIDKKALLTKEIDLPRDDAENEVPLTTTQNQVIHACRSVHPNLCAIELNRALEFQGFHSLDRMSLRAILHQQFPQLNLPPSAFNASITPQDIVDFIAQSTLGNTQSYSPLRQLKAGNTDHPPFVFIHPASGLLFPYEKLIQSFISNRTCFGIEDPALSGHGKIQNSIQDIAKIYLDAIQAQIEEPVILIGYSFGGMLSLEIAHQAERQHTHLIRGVFLLDTWIVSRLENEDVREQIKQGVFELYAEIEQEFLKQKWVNIDLLERLAPRYKQLQELGFAFKPAPLTQTPVILFKASESKKLFSGMQDEHNYLSSVVPEALLTKYSIPGEHMTLLENEKSIDAIVRLIEKLEV